MMGSIGRLPDKEKRKARRRNHVARDLHKSKYYQRVIPSKKHKDKDGYFQEDD